MEAVRQRTKSTWTDRDDTEDYYQFGMKYWNDPAGFVLDCILWDKGKGEGPTPYQIEIMQAMVDNRRISVRGPHGLGKSGLASWIILWFSLTRDACRVDWKIPTTASGWRQLVKFLWPEVHKWSRRINWQKVGRPEFHKDELLGRNLKLRYGEAFALASNKAELIEGAHADSILYVFDESKVIPDATWDSAEGALVNAEGALWFSISTPGEPAGRFYDIQSNAVGYEDWWVRHVTLQEAIDAGRISMKWAEDRELQWGEDSAMYQNRVLGEFAQQEEDSIIPLHWVEKSIKRWHTLKNNHPALADQIGVDVARMGGDKTVIACRHGNFMATLDKHGMIDTNKGSGLVISKMRQYPEAKVVVDIIGVGASVYDKVSEAFNYQDGFEATERVFAFHVQEKTDFMDETEVWEFQDTYSAAWWNLRQMLDPDKGDKQLALPPDPDLKQELMKFRYSVNSNGKIYVLRKEKVKEELGRSPDSGDAVVMACWEPDTLGMESA